MMEVAVENPQQAWEQFKEEVEIMEEKDGGAAAAAGELLTREIKKRLLDHAHENGNGAQVSGGEEEEHKAAAAEEEEEEEAPEEPKVAEEEQQRHKSIFFDAAKGLWKCRHCDWTYCLASPCGNGIVDHRGYRHQIERNLESLVEEGSFYGSPNKEHSTVESPSEDQAAADSAMMPLQSKTQCPNDTTTTTESSASYIHHSHGTVVKPEHSTVESSSEHQTTTTTTTTTTTATATSSSTTTSEAANTSSHTSSAIDGHKSVATTIENGSFTTHASHTAEVKVDGRHVKNIPRGDIPTLPNPQAADPPHVAVPISEDVNPGAPRSQQMDGWDTVKAIVYGGLVESVTSFSVVSAAASSGAKTLDIFILGIANLIGGFPLIFHNIADLRDIQDLDVDDERVGHYWLQLGRRSKARLHMVLALLSYMVFGLLPPVLYGLSFRESNDRERNRMMAVAGASLACIALLALGKAHVKTAPRTYFKTLVYYLTIAVSSSGLSYVAGVLITRLLGHFGVIEQGGASAPPGLSSPFPHAVGAQSSAWASF